MRKNDITAHMRGGCPRAYYGSAKPSGKTVIVGGVDTVVGGWASHEAERRASRWRARPRDPAAELRAHYGGRTYISGQDAVESLIGAREAGPLARAAARLAAAIEQFDAVVAKDGPVSLWSRLGVPLDAPVSVSMITPEDIRDAVPETDVRVLHRVAEDAGILASGYAREGELPALRAPRPPGALPPVPAREVEVRGARANEAIGQLEMASVPRAAAIEAYRGDVASVFDAAAAVLERSVASAASGSGGTRETGRKASPAR